MRKYRLVAKKGEGTFSEVLKAQNVKDGKYHAIKCMKNRFESIDQVNNLREIQALRRLSPHEHIISLEEVLYDQPTGRLALVFELMDANLYELIRGRKHYLNPQLIKSYMWQLMKSLDHMHKKGIFHRDIKPENILIESTTEIGRGLKLADFGSCRGIYSKQPYTEYISTRWYRAPECLLTDGYYGPEMDLWGAGCVMFEITSLYPLFPGTNEVDQISRIHKVLGTPSEEILQKFRSKGASHISFDFPVQKGIGIPQLITHATADTIDLIEKLLKYDASERITAREAMRHPYFKEARESEAKRAGAAAVQGSTQSGQGTQGIEQNNGASQSQSDVKVGTIKSEQGIIPSQSKLQLTGAGGPDPKATGGGTSMTTGSTNGLKALPNILGSNVDGGPPKPAPANIYTSSSSDLQNQSSLALKQTTNKGNTIPIAHTALSALPPIGGITTSQLQGSKGAGGGGEVIKSGRSVNASTSSTNTGTTTSGNAQATQKRRKKYRMNYQATLPTQPTGGGAAPIQSQDIRQPQNKRGITQLNPAGAPVPTKSYNVVDSKADAKPMAGGAGKYAAKK